MNVKHRMTGSTFYNVYKSMMNRCYRPNVKNFHRYGGRGISVTERWHVFENFKEDMYGGYMLHRSIHPGNRQTQLERIDNTAEYSPTNCRWATASEQCLNRRAPLFGRNARLTAKQVINIRHCRGAATEVQLAKIYGVSPTTIGDILRFKSWKEVTQQQLEASI